MARIEQDSNRKRRSHLSMRAMHPVRQRVFNITQTPPYLLFRKKKTRKDCFFFFLSVIFCLLQTDFEFEIRMFRKWNERLRDKTSDELKELAALLKSEVFFKCSEVNLSSLMFLRVSSGEKWKIKGKWSKLSYSDRTYFFFLQKRLAFSLCFPSTT